ncbi:MAG TPA: hypothetical protein VMT68_00465 [Caulobacteraceae bacterium]|nr:hypothetical protein [Caulobacteraceae bacterium]
MDAHTVIEAYVRDVTARLPSRGRADVAMELRALLNEELAARARDAGRPADQAMAMDLLAGFGPPSQVAQRYRPEAPLIDPADTRPFLVAALVGAAVLGALASVAQPHAPQNSLTNAVLAWLGVLVVVFAIRSWAKRRWPALGAWRPRDPDQASRPGVAALVAVMALGIVCYGAPDRIFAAFTGGARLPATLAYDPGFAATRLPWLLAVWGLTAALYAWIAIVGRWRPLTRRVDAASKLGVVLILAWFLADGPMFQAAATDRTVKAWLALIVIGLLVEATIKIIGIARAAQPTPPNAPGVAA